MSHYRRLISYIYAYEGSVKGKNIGYAKIEIRGGQCRIQANVKHIYVGGGEIGVYLLTPGEELLLGRIFIRNGVGEYRTQVDPDNIDGSGCRIDQCYGLTIHDVENAWQCWTTIWEDAVAQTAEIELANVTAENQRKINAETGVQADLERTAKMDQKMDKKIDPKMDAEQTKVEKLDAEQQGVESEKSGQAEDGFAEKTEETEETEDARECPGSTQEDQKDAEGQGKIKISEESEQKMELPISGEIERELEAEAARQEEAAPWVEESGDLKVLEGSDEFKVSEKMVSGQADTVTRLVAGIRTAISGNGLEEKLREMWNETKKNVPQKSGETKNRGNDESDNNIRNTGDYETDGNCENTGTDGDAGKKSEGKEAERTGVETEPFPELENTAFLRELDRLERENNGADRLWQQLQRRYVRVLAFDYEKGCEILSIRPQDIGLLPREIWHYGNNSFLLHGYYNYRHLILARMNNPQGPYRYLLGVPGHYFSNEKYLASMFGFPHFVLARKQPDQDGRFGYWYTEIRL